MFRRRDDIFSHWQKPELRALLHEGRQACGFSLGMGLNLEKLCKSANAQEVVLKNR